MLMFSLGTNAQSSKYKVAFLYNFTNYIDWPAEYKSGSFVIGVLGQDSPIINDLKELAKVKKVHGQSIEIRVFADVNNISRCHILFIPKAFAGKIPAFIENLKGESTLLVSDMPGAIKKGAAISFVERNGKLGYELQVVNAEKYGLKVNSRLATLALNKQ
jgi:hypothetical protein